jgi:ribosomal protein L15
VTSDGGSRQARHSGISSTAPVRGNKGQHSHAAVTHSRRVDPISRSTKRIGKKGHPDYRVEMPNRINSSTLGREVPPGTDDDHYVRQLPFRLISSFEDGHRPRFKRA